MRRACTTKISAMVLGSLILISSVSAKNPTLSSPRSLAKLRCLAKKSETSKKGGLKPSSLVKSTKYWKMGDHGFDYLNYCSKGALNPLALAEAQFHYKTELNERAKWALLQAQRDGTNVDESEQEFGIVLASESAAAAEFETLANRMRFAASCERQFISSKGFGPLGRVVKDALTKSSAKNLLQREVSFGGACPGYRDMNGEQRKNLWVFLMMSMSHYESSCRAQVLNTGPYGVAAGLLQLHHDSEDLYVGSDPDLNCDKGAAADPAKSIKCGLTMIDNQIHKKSSFFDDKSHWQVLRYVDRPGSQASQIRYALSQIPDCKANALAYDMNVKKQIEEKEKSPYKKASLDRNPATLR